MIVHDASVIVPIQSHAYSIIRGIYAHPPAHGARITATVLNDPNLVEEWSEQNFPQHETVDCIIDCFLGKEILK